MKIIMIGNVLCICHYDLEVDSEMVTCQMITSASQHLLFSVFYTPPYTEKAFLESVNSFLNAVSNTDDFNLPSMDLSTGSATVADNLTKSFCEILDDHFLTQTNHYIMRFKNTGSAILSGNILDLVLTNNDALIVDTSVYPHSFDSDHLPLCFSIQSKFKRPNNNSTRKLYCYKKADFDGLRSRLSHVPWDLFISSDDIDSSAIFFQDQVLTTVEQYIPKIKLKQKARPPWIDKDVMKLVRKKKAIWKRLKNNPSTEPTSNFKLLRKETKNLISSKYCKYLRSLADKFKSNRKKFWSCHSIKSKTERLPEVVTYSRVAKSDKNPTEKAHLFNEFFSTVFKKIVPGRMEFPCHVIEPELLLQVSTSRKQVKDILINLVSTKSTGVDGTSARVLKECAWELS